MTDILKQILTVKAREVAAAKLRVSPARMVAAAREAEPPRPFVHSLAQIAAACRPAVIAEIKKASPSKGVIRPNFNPEAIACEYTLGGAACLSVLTDETFFQGNLGYLKMVRAASPLPILRKDFIIDPYQIYEARAAGADAILLIAAALDEAELIELEKTAHSLNMGVLLELHDESELDKCRRLLTPLFGVNNRNLRTFEVSLNQTIELLPKLAGKVVVTESGITSHDDVLLMQSHGVHAFLVGESLMRQNNVRTALQNLTRA